MKKFIPYILIVAMIGTFLFVSFSNSNEASAQTQTEERIGSWQWFKKEFGPGAWKAFGYRVYENPLRLFPGEEIVEHYWGDWGKIADATIGQMVSWISSFAWSISAKIFNISAFLLDYAVDFSVKDFKEHIDQIKVINTGYKIVLNVANMLFIFILLYIAIKTILGMGGDTKKLLTNIIVVALFINFSLFMTKTIIDASNIIAMGFYNGVQTEVGKTKENPSGTGEEVKLISVGSVSTSMMAGLRLQSVIPSQNSEYNKKAADKNLNNFDIAINNFGSSALFLVSAFVFFSVAILFIVRFVALLFYMLFSPVAFLGMISPELKEYSAKWWKGLQSQALFAPAFLFMAYLISAIVNSGQLWTAVGGDDSTSTFSGVFSSSGAGAFPIIMNYVILIALMIGALILAKKMADEGSAGVLKYTGQFQKWAQGVAGRNTLGRAAYLAGNNKYMGKLMAKSPTLGTFVKTKFDSVADTKFGSKTGYATALKKNIEQKKKMADFVAKTKVGKTDELIRKEEERLESMKPLKELKDNFDKARRELYRLSGIANTTYDPADITAADLARQASLREEALLENRFDAESRIKDHTDYRKKVQDKMKKQYAKNIEFASWGEGFGFLDKIFRSGADAAAEIRKPKGPYDKTFKDMLKEYNDERSETAGGAGGAGTTGGGGTTGTAGGGGTAHP